MSEVKTLAIPTGNQMTPILQTLLDQAKKDIEVAGDFQARSEYRVHYPPDDYSDESDLLKSRYKDFGTMEGAVAFRESKKSKRVPEWGQPHIQVLQIKPDIEYSRTALPNSARAVEVLVEAVDRLMREVKRATDKAFYFHCEEKVSAILSKLETK